MQLKLLHILYVTCPSHIHLPKGVGSIVIYYILLYEKTASHVITSCFMSLCSGTFALLQILHQQDLPSLAEI